MNFHLNLYLVKGQRYGERESKGTKSLLLFSIQHFSTSLFQRILKFIFKVYQLLDVVMVSKGSRSSCVKDFRRSVIKRPKQSSAIRMENASLMIT